LMSDGIREPAAPKGGEAKGMVLADCPLEKT